MFRHASLVLVQIVVAIVALHSSACASTAVKKAPIARVDSPEDLIALQAELKAIENEGPLYFETDAESLDAHSLRVLRAVARTMHRVPELTVTIYGNADERGDTGYNLALGERRGEVARDVLVKLGIPRGRVKVTSLGEEDPAMPGADEVVWSLNRRDEFAFSIPGLEDADKLAFLEEIDGEVY